MKPLDSIISEMAFEPGDNPDLVHPEKKDFISTGDAQLDELFPKLPDQAQSYLELITSTYYQDLLARLEKYTGQKADGNVPQLFGAIMKTMVEIVALESQHKKFLVDLALDTVLELPEFEMAKQAYHDDVLRFDLALGDPELSGINLDDASAEPKEDSGLSDLEQVNADLFDGFEDLTEPYLKRRLANMMMQGQAANKTYLFNLVAKQLNTIDDNLVNMYGVVFTVAQLSLYAFPFPPDFVLGQDEAQLGSEEVKPDGEGYVIKARARFFPLLIHEIVKGIYEWISLDPEQQDAMSQDKAATELKDLLVGPEMAKTLNSYIPHDKQNLTPLVQKKFLKLSRDDVKKVLARSDAGQQIMTKVIKQAAIEWSEFQNAEA